MVILSTDQMQMLRERAARVPIHGRRGFVSAVEHLLTNIAAPTDSELRQTINHVLAIKPPRITINGANSK
jgi:hypothetical protein